MTERQLQELRERWDKAWDMLMDMRKSIAAARRVEASLESECERLAKMIVEHDNTEIVITEESGVQHGD